MSTPQLVYVSFDRFPSPKGASTHIAAFAEGLAARFGALELVTLPGDGPYDYPGIVHHPLAAQGDTLIARAIDFRKHLAAYLSLRRPDIIHVRSPFEGYPLALHKPCQFLVAEINGLPSIELKYHYRRVADDVELMRKLRYQERALIEAADLVITPSPVTTELVTRLGARHAYTIPNGVDLDIFHHVPANFDGPQRLRLLFSGTTTVWQGVHTAIEALALYRRDHEATLTIIGPTRTKQRSRLVELASDFGVEDSVRILEPVSRAVLARLHHEHDVALAPLLPNDRNLVQGCCPLKVIEAMAAGPTVVSSDIPAVRALVTHNLDGLLVRPGSAKAIKDALLRLVREHGLGTRLSRAARSHVVRCLTWRHASDTLHAQYAQLLSADQPGSMTPPSN
ncbi:MAG: glycosyltransferase family 4 protein [Myxococcota bacterium]